MSGLLPSTTSRFLRRVQRQQNVYNDAVVLHYDSAVQDLRPWFWYVANVYYN